MSPLNSKSENWFLSQLYSPSTSEQLVTTSVDIFCPSDLTIAFFFAFSSAILQDWILVLSPKCLCFPIAVTISAFALNVKMNIKKKIFLIN